MEFVQFVPIMVRFVPIITLGTDGGAQIYQRGETHLAKGHMNMHGGVCVDESIATFLHDLIRSAKEHISSPYSTKVIDIRKTNFNFVRHDDRVASFPGSPLKGSGCSPI